MDARRRRLPRGVEPPERRCAVQVCGHAAHRVVRGGPHGNQVRGNVQVIGEACGINFRKALLEALGVEAGQVEVIELAPAAVHFHHQRARNHIARRELGGLVIARHEAIVLDVSEHAALAAQGFRKQKPRGVRHKERRGVELDELHIGKGRARAICHTHAIATSHGRVGGFAVNLTQPAGGEQDRARANLRERLSLLVEIADARDASGIGEEV